MKSLQDYLIDGATQYLHYLEETNKGLEAVPILQASVGRNNTLSCTLERALIATDFLQIHIYDFVIDIDSFEETDFNETTRILKLKFSNTLFEKLKKTLQTTGHIPQDSDITLLDILGTKTTKNVPEYIKIFNDLKFLVKNIQEFCMQDSIPLALPTQKPISLKIKLDSYVNAEQRAAIEGVFQYPISYIWGISGSGKTQVVLFSCLFNLITQRKKTLILAPTNTALEQIFIALITQGDKKGLERSKFLRLGMPSSEFLQNFPDVCLYNDEKNEEDSTHKETRDNSLFQTQNVKERLKESLVVGITLDSFVKRYNQLRDLKFAHIFLDECAFSPLIKLIAPLTLQAPITLLGDHKQLMPICLMEEPLIKEKHHAVCVWNLNTLFLEELFSHHATLHTRNNHDDIIFKKIAHYKLTTTHRYGNNLAHILDNYVYRSGLCGVGAPTEVYYIDSVQFGASFSYNNSMQRNESLGEATAIFTLTRTMLDDYAVLTPFRDQQRLLIAKGINRHNVFTIHKSQGKEFDTIIFSPVKFSRYMTDSNNKAALFALNVAISRLKKKLIIVCDYRMWSQKQNQFISALLRSAKPYPFIHKPKTQAMNLPF